MYYDVGAIPTPPFELSLNMILLLVVSTVLVPPLEFIDYSANTELILSSDGSVNIN